MYVVTIKRENETHLVFSCSKYDKILKSISHLSRQNKKSTKRIDAYLM